MHSRRFPAESGLRHYTQRLRAGQLPRENNPQESWQLTDNSNEGGKRMGLGVCANGKSFRLFF
jgi:hypothetical protein